MIVFSLKCHKGHVFESWFRDGATYERQRKRGHVACAICGSVKVDKAPMAPRIASRKNAPAPERAPDNGTTQPVPVSNDPAAAKASAMMKALGELRQQVEKNCDYVGDKFSEEARKIHYGETDKRNIYGETSEAEAHDLAEEGVEFARIPWTPRRNS
ncbi:MAG: DUF1178 family protein [Rhodospirillales bacterium]|nr:DUF1178 family protein [Rhodospirillales bacterium]